MQLNFDKIRPLFGKLTQKQVNGINDIVAAFAEEGLADKRWLAYILATVFHETGQRMQPVKELGGNAYLMAKPYYPYYGRDLVQTTWLINYERVKQFSSIDVVSNPDLIGQMPLAAKVAVVFMKNGWYTGKSLKHYFNDQKSDAINARRIINGKDKAELIAGYYTIFLEALI